MLLALIADLCRQEIQNNEPGTAKIWDLQFVAGNQEDIALLKEWKAHSGLELLALYHIKSDSVSKIKIQKGKWKGFWWSEKIDFTVSSLEFWLQTARNRAFSP